MALLKESSNGIIIPNSDFVSEGIKNWIPYKGSAVIVPINEVYTNPTFVSIKSTNVSPLIGSQSGVITKTSGNALGEGIYTEFYVDQGLRNQPLQLSFLYKTLGTYNNDVKIYVYDTVNNSIIYPNVIDVPVSTGSSLYTCLVTLNDNCNKYRLYFHIATSSLDAFQIQINDINIKKNEIYGGAAIGGWQTFTPTVGITNLPGVWQPGRWRRVGSSIEFTCAYQVTGVATGQISITVNNLLSVLGVSTTDSVSIPGSVIGLDYNVWYVGTWSPQAGTIAGPNTLNWNITVPFTWASTDVVRITASIPIAQWTSNVNLASDFQEFAFNTQSTINTNDTTSFGYGSGGTPILANTAVTYYDVQFRNPIQPTDIIILELRHKATGLWFNINDVVLSTGTTAKAYRYSDHWYWNQHYYDDIRVGAGLNAQSGSKVRVHFSANANEHTGWATLTAATDGYDRWRVRKISNGNMAEVPPVVFTRVWNNNTSQSVPTPGAQTTVLHNTKEEDTHNAYNTSTGVWTCPVAGLYAIQTGVIWSYINAAAGSVKRLYIVKNSSLVAQDRNQTYSTTPVNALIQQTTRRTVRLSVGDTITSRVVDDTYGTSLLATTDSSFTYLELTRIGN